MLGVRAPPPRQSPTSLLVQGIESLDIRGCPRTIRQARECLKGKFTTVDHRDAVGIVIGVLLDARPQFWVAAQVFLKARTHDGLQFARRDSHSTLLGTSTPKSFEFVILLTRAHRVVRKV